MNKRSDKQPSAFDAVLGGNKHTDQRPSATDAVLGGKFQAHSRADELTTYEFDVVKVDAKGLVISRERRQALCFTEDLGDGIGLEMVLIPGGNFLMGSPEDELDRFSHEGSQHAVTIQPFYLGKYPVTQAQWKAVAALPQVKQRLHPKLSKSKGVNHPVEFVTWDEAVEFCRRLTQKTGRQYGLPSEAQWEYACRAGTTTPFHFGEAITPELATYNHFPYGTRVTLEMLQEGITAVGSFGVANAFGLYDMHGLVSEWCADPWHGNYEGAPTDGSTWHRPRVYSSDYYVTRGGSWSSIRKICRCASRFKAVGAYGYSGLGFRVGCTTTSASF
jgi:formylglycine-generating enzyme required for sulfatase activity